LRKLAIILAAGLVAGGGLWMALRPHGGLQELPPRLSQEEMLRAQAEEEDSIKCGHDYRAGSSAYVQCMEQLNAARTQSPPRAQIDAKATRLRNTVTSTVAAVGAPILMLIAFVIMMAIFYGFWALGTWIGLDEMRR
jgi:hypothetical protein